MVVYPVRVVVYPVRVLAGCGHVHGCGCWCGYNSGCLRAFTCASVAASRNLQLPACYNHRVISIFRLMQSPAVSMSYDKC